MTADHTPEGLDFEPQHGDIAYYENCVPGGEMEDFRNMAAALVDAEARLADQAARLAAVEALARAARVGSSIGPIDCTYACNQGPCDCSGEFRPRSWTLNPDDVLRAALHPDPSEPKP